MLADSARVEETVNLQITTHLWVWWLDIASEQEQLAREARQRAVAPTPDDPAGLRLADELSRETRASMVSISASAHALDALYGSVKPLIPPLRSTPPSRHSAILETLKAGFEIRGRAGGGGWAQEFKWLFELRDSAVHHEEKARPTEPHPAGTHTGYENVAYSLENAERALNFAFEVFETCVDRPRQNLPDVVAWAQRMKDPVTAAKGRRQPKPT